MATPIADLGKGGLNTDLSPLIVPPNVFSDVLNVRFDDNAVQTITGEAAYRTIGLQPTYGIHWKRPDQGYNIFAKNGGIIRVDAAGNQSTMFSSGDAAYTDSDWQGTYFNGGFAVVLNNGTTTPLYCLFGSASAGSTFQYLPGWNYAAGLTVTAKVIRSLNYSLIAANLTINDSGVITYAPGTVRVSVQAPTGNIPQVWLPGVTTDTADEFELSSTSQVLDMLDLRGNMFIYSEDSINILTIGTNTKVTPYSKSYGILATDCVCEFDGNHFVVDRNDIYVHNGSGNIESIADFRIKKYFFNNLNKSQTNKVHVVRNPFYKEIWINYPKGNATTCTEALIFNYKNNTWTKRQLANVTYTFNAPQNVSNTFNYAKQELLFTTNSSQTLITNDAYLMYNGTTFAAYDSYISKKINTGDLTGSSLINSIYPVFDKVSGSASISIKVLGQNNYIDNPAYTSADVFTFLPNNQKSQGYKVDPRVNGRVMNIYITSTDYWRLPTLSFDARPADRR
jgi:hypothetical protein